MGFIKSEADSIALKIIAHSTQMYTSPSQGPPKHNVCVLVK